MVTLSLSLSVSSISRQPSTTTRALTCLSEAFYQCSIAEIRRTRSLITPRTWTVIDRMSRARSICPRESVASILTGEFVYSHLTGRFVNVAVSMRESRGLVGSVEEEESGVMKILFRLTRSVADTVANCGEVREMC